jgi:hypothetical protein
LRYCGVLESAPVRDVLCPGCLVGLATLAESLELLSPDELGAG